MKKGLLTILVLLSSVICAAAQHEITSSVHVGEQKTVAGRLKIHFLEVIDDSRCPEGTACVWAGNAKVKLMLSVGRKHQEFELNSDLSPTSIDYDGYRIKFVSLTRKPTQPGRMTMVRPELVVSITTLKH
jgi:hypothetical protein